MGPMKTNTLAAAAALSDQDLFSRIPALAGNEREATAELVAHLAALELRPSLYAAEGYGSLFAYCTEALRLSEDAACNWIEAARACRSFPVILDLLASGSLTLTAVRKLGKHLTPENHAAVLARAKHQKKEQIDALVAELAPQPDVLYAVRKLPVPRSPGTPGQEVAAKGFLELALGDSPLAAFGATSQPSSPASRPVLQPLAPGRYRVQFTIGQEGHDKLRRLQALLCREIPGGDAGVIFERFVDVLLDKVEREKLGNRASAKRGAIGRRSTKAVATSGTGRKSAQAGEAGRAYENRIRSGTARAIASATTTGDAPTIEVGPDGTSHDTQTASPAPKAPSRHIPNAVKRAVWFRDRAQCAFVADTGHRCTERSFLELHHVHPHALDGPATVGNISLRCRRHNRHEAEMVFGRRSSG